MIFVYGRINASSIEISKVQRLGRSQNLGVSMAQKLASLAFVCGSALLVACQSQADRTVTLYRNSPLSLEMRIHWATFDTLEGGDHNQQNCEMAARLLNANIVASAKREAKQPYPGVGFWCEAGAFRESGKMPNKFDSEFPTDTKSVLRFSE
jgi:hypothetical protein